MEVLLMDEQTLKSNPSGLTLTVFQKDIYIANGFWYEVYELIDSDLFVVKKCVSQEEFDTFVCFKHSAIGFGSRENFGFLFDENGEYLQSITNDSDVKFDNYHTVDCEVQLEDFDVTKPGKLSEYRGPENEDNPFVFVFETINEYTSNSYIQFLFGCRVNKKEVDFYV